MAIMELQQNIIQGALWRKKAIEKKGNDCKQIDNIISEINSLK